MMAEPVFKEFILNDNPEQKITTILNGKRCTVRFRYNVTTDRWTFDLRIGDQDVLFGRRIVEGADLLGPFGFDVGGMIAVSFDGGPPSRNALPERRVRFYNVQEDA
jgi:hypothetical protein